MTTYVNDYPTIEKYCITCDRITNHYIGLGIIECCNCNKIDIYD